MGLFKNWKKQEETKREETEKAVASPVSGEAVPLESVSDPVFAEKTLGDGVAVIPSDGRLLAPVDGGIVALFPTGHALGIRTKDGMELLIHIGIDTVKLNGAGFTLHIAEGDQVTRGQLLVSFDLDRITREGYDPVTIMLVSNGDPFGPLHKRTPGSVKAGEKIMWL